MEEYQQRVVDEKTELDGKLSRLKRFVESEEFHNLATTDEQERLTRQLAIMEQYSAILGDRICAF